MDKLKNINKRLLDSNKKYEPVAIAKLSNNDRHKLLTSTSDETSYLILVLYIILILFVSLTILIVIQGDKESPYKIPRKFKGDYEKEKDLTIWDKIYYLIFGTHKVNKYESQCNHLTCKKATYHNNENNNSYDIQGKRKILSNNDKKYQYLETFINNDIKHYSNCNGLSYNNNNNNYTSQFNSSRKCLTGSFNNNNNNNNNNKYSYLTSSVFEELD